VSELRSYAADEVAITLDGTQLDGLGEGDNVVRVSRRVRRYEMKTGADGASTVYRNADKSAECTIQLQQTSRSNAILTGKLTAQDAGLVVPFPFAITDMSGGDVVIAEAAFVAGPADFVRGAAPGTVEWTLILHNCDILNLGVGG
jgi:hypothetical protein